MARSGGPRVWISLESAGHRVKPSGRRPRRLAILARCLPSRPPPPRIALDDPAGVGGDRRRFARPAPSWPRRWRSTSWCRGPDPGRWSWGSARGGTCSARAQAEPGRRFLGVEVVSKYFRLLTERAAPARSRQPPHRPRRGPLRPLRAAPPRASPPPSTSTSPIPGRRAATASGGLFDAETVDLVLGLLVAGGRLSFATDFLDYGEAVAAILDCHPQVALRRVAGGWPEGPRTNYEAKYEREGRPIVRLEAIVTALTGVARRRPPPGGRRRRRRRLRPRRIAPSRRASPGLGAGRR